MAQAANAFGSDPFDIFPDLVWDIILDKLTNAQDLVNIITVFPGLNGRHFERMIADLMPLLAPKYLSFKDMLNCRLVSKRWKNAVDSVLENHPDRLPYQPIPTNPDEKLLVSETHPHFQKLPKFGTKTELLLSSERREQILNFPENKNPFIGRTLTFTIAGWKCKSLLNRPPRSPIEIINPMDEGLPLLQRFGQYIWYFELLVYRSELKNLLTTDMVQFLIECLSYLPNLKSLRIGGTIWNANSLDFPTTLSFPPANLEVLDLTGLPRVYYCSYSRIVSALLTNYGDGLKKLMIYIGDWDEGPVELLPSLTHLSLKYAAKYPFRENILDRIRRVFEQLKNPLLVKKLELMDLRDSIHIYNLLSILKPYKIEALEVQAECMQLSSMFFDGTPPIQLLKLRVRSGQQFNCTFVNQLPDLKFLSIDITCIQGRIRPNTRRIMMNRAKTLHASIEDLINAYCHCDERVLTCAEFSIFRALPGLQMLSVEEDGRISRRYVEECGNRLFTS